MCVYVGFYIFIIYLLLYNCEIFALYQIVLISKSIVLGYNVVTTLL